MLRINPRVSLAQHPLHTSRSGKLPGLEAFFAEHRTPLRRPERYGRFLAACRTHRHGLYALARCGRIHGSSGAFCLAGFTTLRLVLEVLVGEKLLFARRPDELRAAVNAPEDPVLELHRSLPRRTGPVLLTRATPARVAASFDFAYAPAPAWPGVYRRVSDRKSAS